MSDKGQQKFDLDAEIKAELEHSIWLNTFKRDHYQKNRLHDDDRLHQAQIQKYQDLINEAHQKLRKYDD